MSYVVITDDDDRDLGYTVIGPFATWEEALEWANGYPNAEDECLITHLLDPKEIDG